MKLRLFLCLALTLLTSHRVLQLFGSEPNNESNSSEIDLDPATVTGSEENRFLNIAVNYAETMIKNGRDTYGDEHSPLFASALNRKTREINTSIMQIKIPGVRADDRSITGSNPLHDKYLYSTLYLLSETTGNNKYEKAADEALNYFFKNCQSPNTGLLTWGEHIYWDFFNDTIGFAGKEYHEADEWPLWERVYTLAPDAAFRYAIGLWNNQVADRQTGDFSRHAGWSTRSPQKGADFPRYAGQMIEVWADACARTDNDQYRDTLLHAVNVLLSRMEQNREETKTKYVPAFRGAKYVWTDNFLELARCLGHSAKKIDDPELSERMNMFAKKLDTDFFKAPHITSPEVKFAVTLDAATGEPITRSMNRPYTATWESGYGYIAHCSIANNCYERYIDLKGKEPVIAEEYKKLILQTGKHYLNSTPDTTEIIKPRVFAQVIRLMLNCYELTSDKQFSVRAVHFCNLATDIFFTGESPLPRASNKHAHYESLTGGPDFIYALLLTHNAADHLSE